MRFILVALVLIGTAFYLYNEEILGKKNRFQLSDNGRIVSQNDSRSGFDFSKIGEFGTDLFNSFTEDAADESLNSAPEGIAAVATVEPQGAESQALIATSTPDITTYKGQMLAISNALQSAPEATAAHMQTAMQACLTDESPAPLTNYFVGLVQVVSQTSQLPQAQQAESFAQFSAPLTQAVKAWLKFQPDDERAVNTAVLQRWAAQPQALVACNLPWLAAE